jgi:hypothetical protein
VLGLAAAGVYGAVLTAGERASLRALARRPAAAFVPGVA